MFKNIKKRLLNWAINKIFDRYFDNFEFPFVDADRNISKMSAPKRHLYLESVRDWVSSDAYENEMSSILQQFYKKLVKEPRINEHLIGYRMCLVFIKKYEERLKELVQRHEVDTAVDNTINNI